MMCGGSGWHRLLMEQSGVITKTRIILTEMQLVIVGVALTVVGVASPARNLCCCSSSMDVWSMSCLVVLSV